MKKNMQFSVRSGLFAFVIVAFLSLLYANIFVLDYDDQAEDAVNSGNVKLLQSLEGKFDVNVRINGILELTNNSTLLIIATRNHDVDMVRYLLSVGADPAAQDNSGYAAIHYAAENTDMSKSQLRSGVEILKMLSLFESTLKLRTSPGMFSPLQIAKFGGAPMFGVVAELKKLKVQILETAERNNGS